MGVPRRGRGDACTYRHGRFDGVVIDPEAFDYTRIACNKRKPLLNRDALGEIPRLIHIALPSEGGVLGNKRPGEQHQKRRK